jgi:hypothetical protein
MKTKLFSVIVLILMSAVYVFSQEKDINSKSKTEIAQNKNKIRISKIKIYTRWSYDFESGEK